MSFLGLEGHHVFVTGAAGGIGSEAVREFLCESSYDTISILAITSSPLVPIYERAQY